MRLTRWPSRPQIQSQAGEGNRMNNTEVKIPQAPDAELAILGGLLLEQSVPQSARARLSPAQFFVPSSRKIYQALLELDERRVKLDPVVTAEELRKMGRLEEVGGFAYIATLTDRAIRGDLDSHVNLVVEAAEKREYWTLGAELMRKSSNGHKPEQLRKIVKRAAEETKPSGGAEESGAYACVQMKDIPPEKGNWLWKPYLPIGKITLLDGWPGIGKSWLTCKLAAIVTRGGGFPNAPAFMPGNVLMFSAEDGLADTLRPRLDACGADVDRVIALNFLEKDGLAIFDPKGLIRFEATIIEYQPKLVIIDPLFAFTGGAMDIHRANECREVSRILAAIAARQRCNMLCVRHLNKSGGNGDPMKSGIGSIDWLAAARVGLLAGCDPDDKTKRALTNYKNNLAGEGDCREYPRDFPAFI